MLDFQSLTLGPHYLCLQPYLFTFQGRGWQKRENMRVSLQTVISHGFLCVQNPASDIAKTGDVARKETHGLWTPFAPYLDKACPVLVLFLFKNQTHQERTHQPMLFLSPSTLTFHLFSFCFSSPIFSDLQQGGQEEELLLLLFLHYPLMNFSSATH